MDVGNIIKNWGLYISLAYFFEKGNSTVGRVDLLITIKSKAFPLFILLKIIWKYTFKFSLNNSVNGCSILLNISFLLSIYAGKNSFRLKTLFSGQNLGSGVI